MHDGKVQFAFLSLIFPSCLSGSGKVYKWGGRNGEKLIENVISLSISNVRAHIMHDIIVASYSGHIREYPHLCLKSTCQKL